MASFAQGVRRLGFRKWYERQLIDSHLALVTCFLCMVTVAALLEDMSFKEGAAKALIEGTVVFACGIVGWFAFHRYQVVMTRAERYGAQSTCSECEAYGRLEVLDAAADGDEWIRVRCRKCSHAWTIK